MQRNLVNSILKSSTRKLEMASYPFLMGELNLSREGVHAFLVKKQLKDINGKWKRYARLITKSKARRSKQLKATKRVTGHPASREDGTITQRVCVSSELNEVLLRLA